MTRASAARLSVLIILILLAIGCALFLFGTREGRILMHHPHRLHDLLVAHRDDSVVGVLQGLVQREGNNSVRLKLEKALKDMNASIGTF